jgi:uncharacterized protein (TIGR00369 family)
MIQVSSENVDVGQSPEEAYYDAARRSHAGCVICGDKGVNPHSLGLSFDRLADGSVSASCNLDACHQGYDGILHGGIISTLLDAAMTHCLFAAGIRAVTAEMTVRFVAPVATHCPFALTAKLLAHKRRTYLLEARMVRNSGLLARATAKFIESRLQNQVLTTKSECSKGHG